MSQNHKPNFSDDDFAAALTAFALGELTGDEAARLAQQLQREPGLQREVAEIRRLALALRPETAEESWTASAPVFAAAPDSVTRAAVLAALESTPPFAARHEWPSGKPTSGTLFSSQVGNDPIPWRGARLWLTAIVSTAALVLCAVFLVQQTMAPRNVAMQPTSGRAATLEPPSDRAASGALSNLAAESGSVAAYENEPASDEMAEPPTESSAKALGQLQPGNVAFDAAAAGNEGDKQLLDRMAKSGADPGAAFHEPAAASAIAENAPQLEPHPIAQKEAAAGFGGGKKVADETSRFRMNELADAPAVPREIARRESEVERGEAVTGAPQPDAPQAMPSTILSLDKSEESKSEEAHSVKAAESAQSDGLAKRNNSMPIAPPSAPGTVGAGLAGEGSAGEGSAGGSSTGRDTLGLDSRITGGQGFRAQGGANGLGAAGRGAAGVPHGSGQPAPDAGVAGALSELNQAGSEDQRMYYGLSPEAEARQRRDARNEQYARLPENPFIRAAGAQALSTLAIDVDTASYANVRKFLRAGTLPPAEAVRIEEFINYFDYAYPQPDDEQPFRVDLKLFGCPWNSAHALLRVGVQGRDIPTTERPPSNLVFLVDVSGSMSSEDKLPLLKRGLQLLASRLSETDTVSIVTYAGEAGVALPPTNGGQQRQMLEAIDRLKSGGSTHGSAGIEMAYRLAEQNFRQDGVNRVIWATDGDLNVGVTDDQALVQLIQTKAASGVFLTVLGFGTGNLKDAKLEALADNGNGVYAYIDAIGEAHKVLVEQMSANLVTIAKDVKIQIEFNPAQVAAYRLIGYENRIMPSQDFANDRKDGGEIGAGHTVTALYEVIPAGTSLEAQEPSGVELKYQQPAVASRSAADSAAEEALTEAALQGELATVAVRFKAPDGQSSSQVEFAVGAETTSFSQTDDDSRFAAAVAAFAMRLRNSMYAGSISYEAIAEIAGAARGADPQGYRAEFVELVHQARQLTSQVEAAPAPATGGERE